MRLIKRSMARRRAYFVAAHASMHALVALLSAYSADAGGQQIWSPRRGDGGRLRRIPGTPIRNVGLRILELKPKNRLQLLRKARPVFKKNPELNIKFNRTTLESTVKSETHIGRPIADSKTKFIVPQGIWEQLLYRPNGPMVGLAG